MITVKLPTGGTAQFPDGTPTETIEAALQQQFGGQQSADPSSASLPSAQQQGVAVAPVGYRPGSREYADWARSQAMAGNPLPQVSKDPNSADMNYQTALARVRASQFPNMSDEQWKQYSETALAPYNPTEQGQMGSTLGFADEVGGLVAGLGAGARQMTGGGGTGFGPAFSDVQNLEEARYRAGQAQNGVLGGVAETVGGLGAFGPGRKMLQEAIARTGPIAQQAAQSLGARFMDFGKTALSSSAAGGITGYAQGFGTANGGFEERNEGGVSGGLAGLTIGAAVPVGTAAIAGAGRGVYRAASPIIRSALDPIAEAGRRLGTAYSRDAQFNPSSVASMTDEAAARAGGVPLTNVDRGGETVRALARSVANQNPEARQTLTNVAQDRFRSQAARATTFIKKVMGGATDDIALQNSLDTAARASNRPAYRAAYDSPSARAIWTKRIQELMQSDIFRKAVNAAESSGTDQAALMGSKAVRNPFEFLPDGTITLKTNPDGSRALPSLEFWDIVQRELRRIGKTAQGDDTLRGTAEQLRRSLNGELDTAVPAFQKARQGAYEFFQAEDALDAGRKAAGSTRQVPEIKSAHAKFSQADKDAAAVGYASSLIDMVNSAQDRANVIESLFNSPARRELNELFLGPAKAREIEAYVRVEGLADRLRNALGNSTTARQLVELGLGGVGGFTLTGDWQGALGGAVLTKGARYAGEKIDARVMEQLAKLLTSKDPADLSRAVQNAALSPKWLAAVQALNNNVAATGGTLTTSATQ